MASTMDRHIEVVKRLAKDLPRGTTVVQDDGSLVRWHMATDHAEIGLRRQLVEERPRERAVFFDQSVHHIEHLLPGVRVPADAPEAWDAAIADGLRELDEMAAERKGYRLLRAVKPVAAGAITPDALRRVEREE